MLELVLVPFILVVFTIYLFIINQFHKGFKQIKTFKIQKNSQYESISCIIPFRNEQENIAKLVKGLIHQTLPCNFFEIIFIDDYSTDNSYHELQKLIEDISNFRVIKNIQPGKKNAIKLGVESALNPYIITTDADCTHNKNWLTTISQFIHENKPDLVIAPVTLQPIKNFFEQFQDIDFLSLITSGAGATGINKPIMCNGANLIFSKQLYKNASAQIINNYASGDDIFLLQYAKSIHAKIQFLKNREAIVYTEPVHTMKSFLFQRVRWASKSKGYSDKFTLIVAWIVFVTNTLSAFLPILLLLSKEVFFVGFLFFLLKSTIDYRILKSGANFMQKPLRTITFIMSQLIYPFYIVFTVFYAAFGNVKWKDRNIIINKN
ncbi:glycosyltransferase [Plebeiibacterium sediminum]|uniref:Glycosyltransferase n=1 Tax=Plebeiibacterium sediminum TaxID=2992112 RepID=A0AAE3M0Y6_9BACT|nr:glycosyltransferase [Plebeiobacterium sediminum]MCW3785074.1 glycosyltransferase [Plebeiobacterium sediminum]